MATAAATYDRWFAAADADADGRLTGADAVAFFQRSGLPRDVLARVWDLANSSRAGYLDRAAFHKAMDLISLAQQGRPVTKEAYLAALSEGGGGAGGGPDGAAGGGGGIAPPRMAGLHVSVPGANGTDGGGAAPASPASPRAAAAPSPSPQPQQQQQQQYYAPAPAPQYSPGPPDPQPRLGRGASRRVPPRVVTSVVDGLKAIYFSKVKPLEEAFKFSSFFSACLHESDFEAKPSVLLLGQYSTG